MKTNNDLIRTLVDNSGIPFASDSDKQAFIDDWYFARAFVSSDIMKDKMCRVDDNGNMTDALNITLEGTSPRMCAVLRELILRAHYADFNEQNGNNASTITLLYNGSINEANKTLLFTPFLANYLHYVWVQQLDFLDIKILLKEKKDDSKIDVTEKELDSFSVTKNNTIDTTRAEHANQIYCLGDDLYNLPAIDTLNVEMYELPLRVFETESYKYNREKDWEHNSIKDKLSNVFCTDTFDLRKEMLERILKNKNTQEKTLTQLVRKNILALSKCEHSRWIAEKLIMGFRPWTPLEHYQYDRLFGDDKKQFYKTLKKNEAHYNLCSYRDLARREPQNMKFDTFLVLVMLDIIRRAEKG